MALVSPGVQVSVIDESFYTPAEPGTTPVIFVATQENKTNPGGTGIAPGTQKANAGKVYLVSSQRELAETFGDPLFYTDNNNNPIHGSEQNEYGLQAAYSFLGVANRAYVVRADLDLAAITGSTTETAGKAKDGAYWFDTDDSLYGVFQWNGEASTTTNGQTFANKLPIVITDSTQTSGSAPYTPKTSVGAIGDYAIVAVSTVNRLWYKNTDGNWVEVGSANWKKSWPWAVGGANPTPASTGNISFDTGSGANQITTTGTDLATIVSDINGDVTLSAAGITAKSVNSRLNLYYDGSSGDSIVVAGDAALLTALGIEAKTYYNTELAIAPHTSVPEFKSRDSNPRPTGSLWIKTTEPNLGAKWSVKQYDEDTDVWSAVEAKIHAGNAEAIYEQDRTGGGANLPVGTVYIRSNLSEDSEKLATFELTRRLVQGAVTATSGAITATSLTSGTNTFTFKETVKNSSAFSSDFTVTFTANGNATDAAALAGAINGVGATNVTASVNSKNQVVIQHALGGEIRITDGTNAPIGSIFSVFDADDNTTTANFYYVPGTDGATDPEQYNISGWNTLTYTASNTEPTTTPADGALWYSSTIDEIDIMIHDGTTWKGYHNYDHTGNSLVGANSTNNAEGPIVAATEPEKQSDGVSALVEGDLWISTADLANFPKIYRWDDANSKWVLLDSTDQTTENGVLFADARYNTSGANSADAGDIDDLLISDYLDPDAPDPALYPKGMLLYNTRRSGFNVKKFVRNHIDVDGENARQSDESMSGYYANRWVTESANNQDGSGSFGSSAQRKVVVQALQAAINSNEDIRDDETRIFNLIASPGYPELIGEMISLNYDRGLTAFVVGDSPMTLAPTTTSISDWASNVNAAVEDNDVGLVSRDEYLGVYYPAGFTSDNAGNNIVVPPSHMALRTIALSDQVSYPWFAPAGTRRGGVTNATATGYIDGEGEFVSAALNEGQRDTLYANNVNPITFLNGAGLVVFGQKTRARSASALDRVNVARLTVYLRSQLKKLAKPYIFEPNDKITRDEIKQQVESLLVELIGLRAIYDYLVVCDETNNTPNRIDRNELYVDIAIEPVKAVEFIYIPLRLKNTGEIAGL
jgi:hypothetical protein